MYHSPLDVSVIGKASAAGARPSMCWKLSATLAAWGAVRQKLTVLLALTIGPAHVVGTGPVVGLAEFTIVGAAWARAACLTELEGNASIGEVKLAAARTAAPLLRARSVRICMGDLLWPGCVLQLAGGSPPLVAPGLALILVRAATLKRSGQVTRFGWAPYRATAEFCGTTHKTVRRVVERRAEPPRQGHVGPLLVDLNPDGQSVALEQSPRADDSLLPRSGRYRVGAVTMTPL